MVMAMKHHLAVMMVMRHRVMAVEARASRVALCRTVMVVTVSLRELHPRFAQRHAPRVVAVTVGSVTVNDGRAFTRRWRSRRKSSPAWADRANHLMESAVATAMVFSRYSCCLLVSV
jgi:hypothetical protein